MLNVRSRRDYKQEEREKSCQQSMKSFCAHTHKVPTVKEHSIDYVARSYGLTTFLLCICGNWKIGHEEPKENCEKTFNCHNCGLLSWSINIFLAKFENIFEQNLMKLLKFQNDVPRALYNVSKKIFY